MSSAFIETSVILRRLFDEPGAIDWTEWQTVVASQLAIMEGYRTLDRMRLQNRPKPAMVSEWTANLRSYTAGMGLASVTPAVLRRAAQPLPVPLKTLDAIHLMTAVLWREQTGEPPIMLTHDRQLAAAARAFGFEVRP